MAKIEFEAKTECVKDGRTRALTTICTIHKN